MAHDQVNLTDIRKDISSPSLQRRLPTKKWSASNRVFIMGFGGLVVLGIVVAVSYAFKNQKTYNQSKELFQSLEAAKALRIIVKLEENYAVIEDEDEYIVQVAGHKVEKDAFGMNMVATMSTNGTKYVYRIYNQQVVYEEYNISSGNMTVSNCVAKDNLPPVAEFAQSILDGEVMDNEKYENFDCDNGKAVQVEWSNQALMYCMVKDKNGEVRIRTVVAQHISATVKYVDDEDVANMIKAAVNKPFVDENGTEKSCSVLYDTKSLSQTRRALQNAKPNENNGAHNIDFFYNSELEWTYGQALSTLTLNQYFDPHLNHGGNRFAYGYRNYDNHAYNADRHENFLYSTVDLINLMHGAGVRRLSYRAKNKMVCVFVHGANVVPRREGLQGRSNSRYWGKIKNKNCDSVKYLELNTWDYAWNDPELQTKTCEYLISAISKRKCGTVLSEMLIITHGSGALQVASALSSGKCSLGRTSKILPIQPPMDGSIYYAKAFYKCIVSDPNTKGKRSKRYKTYEPISCKDGEFSPANYALYSKFDLARPSLSADFKLATDYLQKHTFRRLCGDYRDGVTSGDTITKKLVQVDVNSATYGQDSIVDFSSCTTGYSNTSLFRSTPFHLFYRAAISHNDGRLHHSDSRVFFNQQPRKWLQTTIDYAHRLNDENPVTNECQKN